MSDERTNQAPTVKVEPLPLPRGPGGTEVVTAVVTERAGDRIGSYKLLQQIGEGGCGVVYMAEQEEPVRRRVALKVIKLGMDTKSVIARFEAERQALALMDHPHIARVLDAGTTATGRPFFVMELVRGVPMTQYCDQNKLPTEERLRLFIQVCQAIQHAHQKGIIHRDIKPSNILVTSHDGMAVPKVIDFGIAKATQGRLTDQTLFTAFEQFIGTPAYMSPEQAQMSGLDIDTRSDIYALGVLLYELLVGQTPFDMHSLLESGLDKIRQVIREKEPERPSTRLRTMVDSDLTAAAQHRHTDAPKLINLIRGDLDWIVMKTLEKDRTRRYETANGLAMDVQRYLANEPIVARPPSRIYRFEKMVRRNRGLMTAAGAVLLALLLGLGLSCYLLVQEREALRRERVAEQEQVRLRTEAEKALAIEAQLRVQAEVGEKLAAASRLLNDGHIDDAEQAVYAVAHPASAPLLNTMGQMRVRRGEWSHAITNYTRLTEMTPGEPTPYYNLAALLAYVDDEPAWQANSRKIIEQFPADRAPSVLERMAKACLILPPLSADDLAAAVRLADIAVPGNANRKAPETFRLARALAEYRRERFAAALRWLEGSAQEGEVARQAQAEAIRAMAQFRRGDRDTARATLAKAAGLADSLPTKGPTVNAQWPERFMAASLVREAKALLEPSKMSKSDGAALAVPGKSEQ